MFICLVFTVTRKGESRLVRLPTLEQGREAIALIEHCLLPYASDENHIYIAQEAIPLHDLEQFMSRWSISKRTQPLAFMYSYAKRYKLKWKKLNDFIEHVRPLTSIHLKQDDWGEAELFSAVEKYTAGRLLHLYELQRCLQHYNIQLTLEKLMSCLARWSFEEKIELLSGIEIAQGMSKEYRCRRCANRTIKKETYRCYSCGDMCYYCPQCVTLGKVKTCTLLVRFRRSYETDATMLKQLSVVEPSPIVASYGLSQAQYDAVMTLMNAILRYYRYITTEHQYKSIKWLRSLLQRQLNYILWAVTGAGKTEMIFPLIHLFQLFNMKVLVAIPRRDVVQELLPRLSRAFPNSKVIGLYGGSEQTWEVGHIYIATTHQLIRFDTYFDLVILDEMDAFPYYNNETLIRTLHRVQKPTSCFIQLTATVPEAERLKMRLGWQRYVQVPVRYHQKPLPVPQFIILPPLSSILKKGEIPAQLKSIVASSVARGAVMFMFVQRKSYLAPLSKLLESTFPHHVIAFTSADDQEREVKVLSFRKRDINVLITTSILERGVTIPKSDICIMDVHHRAFSRPAIVQMAGRAGRSSEDPHGNVFLCGQFKTSATRQAIREIKQMNKLAIRKGYMKGK